MPPRHNFQNIAWFWDLNQRELIDLEPPYQRRSVWNQDYKDYFIDTILLQYPAPAIFLFEEISADGKVTHHVVDGKQRLTTLFEFIEGAFPVSEKAEKQSLRGKYFEQLDPETRKAFWGYQFLVEYLPSSEEGVINNIFDRINRNMAKLTAQELRHARFDGAFIKAAESLSEEFPTTFPRIAEKSRKQMKDVELTATLLLLLEEGPKGYSQIDLDKAFSDRDAAWDAQGDVEKRFRAVVAEIHKLTRATRGNLLVNSRFRNQADFYSLFGALDTILVEGLVLNPEESVDRLLQFNLQVEDEATRASSARANEYYQAARSASNDVGPRRTRINIIRDVLVKG